MEDAGDHEDAVRARHEYRGVIDSVHVVEEGTGAASAAASDPAATASERVACHVASPTGGELHKSTFNTELQIADAKGESVILSPDRLERVKQEGIRLVAAGGGADDGDAEGKATRTKLQRGVDIAQAFQRDDDQGSYFQLGRVQAMYSNTSGSYKEWRLPLDFESRQSGLTLVCRWYSRVRQNSDVKWKYDCGDLSRYFAQFTTTLDLGERTR